jgi:GNAT superfamily N-acetyltransferase
LERRATRGGRRAEGDARLELESHAGDGDGDAGGDGDGVPMAMRSAARRRGLLALDDAGGNGERFSRGARCTRLARMRWRQARAEDDRALVEHMLGLYAEDPGAAPVGAEQCQRTLLRLRGEPVRGVALALEGDAAVTGYALLCSFWSNELGGEVCIIDELFVAPSARGRGAATELVSGLFERRLPWFADAVAIELEVTPGNTRARQLYQRLGFRPYKNALMRALRGS